MEQAPRVAVFGPNPVLGVTVERLGDFDDVHFHAAGQGVWVARMAAELGAEPVLCGLIGGESGQLLRALLEALPCELRLTETKGASGSYVIDRRGGERKPVAQALAPPASRHEVDNLFSQTCAAALGASALAVCNPYPGDGVPEDIYGSLVEDVRSNGTPVLVDLSSPRLDSALEGRPDLVKLNDWELAQYVKGPVSEPDQLRAAVERLIESGARSVAVTRGAEPAVLFRDGAQWELEAPRFERGAREGCGDSMMGALATAFAAGLEWEEAMRLGAAAGAANFLRHGLGSASREVVEDLAPRVQLRRVA